MASKNRLSRLPLWISHWLGYRSSQPKPPPAWAFYLWTFVGSFTGISIIEAIFMQSSYFHARHAPIIVASLGASAVLCYGNIETPLSQPRNLIGGHFLSALSGLCVTKLMRLLPTTNDFNWLRWLAGSLSTSTAIIVMAITGTTHPPAGATALLISTDDMIYAMGWYYLPVVLLSTTMILGSALLINNIQRQYPKWWWKPDPPAPSKSEEEEKTTESSHSSGEGSQETQRSPSNV